MVPQSQNTYNIDEKTHVHEIMSKYFKTGLCVEKKNQGKGLPYAFIVTQWRAQTIGFNTQCLASWEDF